jgi:hypothetical protein
MRRSSLFAALIILPACLTIACSKKPLPGVEYTFSGEVLSAVENRQFSGTVSVAGDYAALEFDKGDGLLWKEHVILVTSDAGKTYTVILPDKKSYYESNDRESSEATRKALKTALAKLNFEVSDVRSFMDDEGRDSRILDYPTHRYKHELLYDISMSYQGKGIAASTRMITTIWTTEMLPERYASFLRQHQARTGLANLDATIAEDMQEVRGFPLKQSVRTVVTVGEMPQTSTANMQVDDFVETDIPMSRFEVPDGFDEIDPPAPDFSSMMKLPS